jgi:hypothetical protein
MVNNSARSSASCKERKGYPHRILKGSSPTKKDGIGKIYPKKINTLKNTGGANKLKLFSDIHCINKGKLNSIINAITAISKRLFVNKANKIKMIARTEKEKMHRINEVLRMDLIMLPNKSSLF